MRVAEQWSQWSYSHHGHTLATSSSYLRSRQGTGSSGRSLFSSWGLRASSWSASILSSSSGDLWQSSGPWCRRYWRWGWSLVKHWRLMTFIKLSHADSLWTTQGTSQASSDAKLEQPPTSWQRALRRQDFLGSPLAPLGHWIRKLFSRLIKSLFSHLC